MRIEEDLPVEPNEGDWDAELRKEAKNYQKPDECLIAILLKAMDVCRRKETANIKMIKRVIVRTMEPRTFYTTCEAADVFGLSRRRFLAKAKAVGLKPRWHEEGVGLYEWHEVVAHLKRHWRERVKQGW